MDQEKFPKKEFIKECVRRGYTTWARHDAESWCKQHPKEFYTESDMIDVYRYSNAHKIGTKVPEFTCTKAMEEDYYD